MQTGVRIFNRHGGPPLVYAGTPGRSPTVMFLAGFRSDMTGAKALHLEQHCARRGQGFLRFDYRGHGASGGRFEDGCIGDWLADALTMLDEVVPGPVVLVGSSMGGWIMLLVALARPERVQGLVGIAAAPDFTHDLILHGGVFVIHVLGSAVRMAAIRGANGISSGALWDMPSSLIGARTEGRPTTRARSCGESFQAIVMRGICSSIFRLAARLLLLRVDMGREAALRVDRAVDQAPDRLHQHHEQHQYAKAGDEAQHGQRGESGQSLLHC